jgi:hypothetical protein
MEVVCLKITDSYQNVCCDILLILSILSYYLCKKLCVLLVKIKLRLNSECFFKCYLNTLILTVSQRRVLWSTSNKMKS